MSRRSRALASRHRRGIALMDVIIGGIMLGVGLAVIMSVASRALARQTDGEKRLVASWLADELLNMVLIEGPVDYPRRQDTSGTFRPPFDDFAFEVVIDDRGNNVPFEVTAVVSWPAVDPRSEVVVQTLLAQRRGDPEQPRAPLEPIDRDGRYFEEESPPDLSAPIKGGRG